MSQHAQAQQQHYQAQQSLKLSNPTPYHLSALNNGNYANAPHPLADIDMQQQPQHHQQLSPPYHTATRDPMSDHQQRNSIDFNDSFSQHIMSDHDDHLEYQQNPSLYDRSSFSSAIDHHRRSSAATDISLQNAYHNQQPMFIPGGGAASLDSASHSLAMSAPANMYDYNSFHVAAATAGAGAGDHGHHDSLENGASGTSASNSVAARSFEDDYQIQMNMQLMMEKRRRRRESHNAVERRRRDNINDRIQELCSLLPETALEGSHLGPNNKPNKGAILRKSVDHIKQLQQELSNYLVRVEELENTLKMYQQQGAAGPR